MGDSMALGQGLYSVDSILTERWIAVAHTDVDWLVSNLYFQVASTVIASVEK